MVLPLVSSMQNNSSKDPMLDLNKLSTQIQTKFDTNESIKSFAQYLEDFKNNSKKFSRSAAQYLKDVFETYGSYKVKNIAGEEVNRWGIFDQFGPVFGQEHAQDQIYNYICSFAESRVNKIILLHGPNGSAKTSLIAAMMLAMEEYSHTPEGAVYAFNWIFSDVGEQETGLGFGAGPSSKFARDTLAFTAPQDITFKLACSMKDNPLLLIPKKERKEFFESLGLELPAHLLEAELCQKCNEIFNQLSISYKGDWLQIVRHIQVERFYFSKRFRKGLISIDPQINRDANSRPLNIEQSYRIPRVLALSSMYEPYGDLVDANRGMVEFSEIFKRGSDANKYLLTTAQWGTISLPNFTAYLDCVIIATDNQTNLTLFKRQLDWPSFNGRFAYVRVPYNLKWSEEKKACDKIIKSHVRGLTAPHSVETLSLWAILTRLRQSSEPFGVKLNYIEKAILYDKHEAPDSWKTEDKQSLVKELKAIASEYDEDQSRVIDGKVIDATYEGRSGASYREIENIVIACTNKKNYISPVLIFNAIKNMIKDESVYEFTRLYWGNKNEAQDGILYEKGYLEPELSLDEARIFYVESVWNDLSASANLISEEEYTKLFTRYLQQTKAWIQHEKIKNPNTGVFENPNEKMMQGVEKSLGISTSEAEDYRRGIFNKIAAWALENPNSKEIPYSKLFSDSIDLLKKTASESRESQLERLATFILYHNSEDWQLVPEEDKEWVVQTIENLKKLGYTDILLKEALVFVIKELQK